MAMPFQILDFDQQIAFNIDFYDQNVEGYFISLMRNAIKSTRNKQISFDDIVFSLHQDFELPIDSSIRYANIFIHLMSEDHGYFRFDDDPANQNGDYHPRYHFDFFCKNSTAVKIGTDVHVDIDCFYSLFDNTHTKHYLRR